MRWVSWRGVRGKSQAFSHHHTSGSRCWRMAAHKFGSGGRVRVTARYGLATSGVGARNCSLGRGQYNRSVSKEGRMKIARLVWILALLALAGGVADRRYMARGQMLSPQQQAAHDIY